MDSYDSNVFKLEKKKKPSIFQSVIRPLCTEKLYNSMGVYNPPAGGLEICNERSP